MPLPSSFVRGVHDCVARFPLLHDARAAPLAYGTAGFRTTGSLLPAVAARVAFVVVLRVWWAVGNTAAPAGCAVGCMITASHNPAADNGLKLVDVDGGMLAASWEGICTAAANAATGEELLKALEDWATTNNICPPTGEAVAVRCPFGAAQLARDTRPSGVDILRALVASLEAAAVPFADHGTAPTPLLHYMVQRANRPSTVAEVPRPSNFGPALYRHDVLSALAALLHAVVPPSQGKRKRQKVVVDAANGVGTLGMKAFLRAAQELPSNPLEEFFDIVLLHDDVDSVDDLNHMCGADFTQKTRSPSADMKRWAAVHREQDEEEEVHYYTLDGDADRVVAFLHDSAVGDVWHLLDGDRMLILYALALRHWLGECVLHSLDVGAVQTAYANGASTDYLQHRLGLRVYTTATGVKHLHPIAHQRDIGVYFEANGHGTVLFNCEAIASKLSAAVDPQARAVLEFLPVLLSQVCGDGIADLFACELVLLALRMSFRAWYQLYTDLPSLQSKVAVSNPKVVTNTPDERRALSPPGLQDAIDAAVAAASAAPHSAARAFVRPSGTEPIVRVYAEASDAAACKKLGDVVEGLVRRYCE
ncbi:phosphoacetylglucosamine mutase [Trypanosoma grayi]|uniref:phosphoacetylglucosamine mutase n=1 Tax=Trypanosoma grayi TaxID=71804 RepID=UPI0004F3F13D|nr:phosphoacetylglucosamine mutase [Trypanosoma grayi]KEG07249.1 phosphoacetylglucosamine mutase [Trypanosoma grayi]